MAIFNLHFCRNYYGIWSIPELNKDGVLVQYRICNRCRKMFYRKVNIKEKK